MDIINRERGKDLSKKSQTVEGDILIMEATTYHNNVINEEYASNIYCYPR